MAAGLTVGHLLVTAVAAPVNFSQRTHTGDPAALARVFDTFERLTAARTVLQAATLAAMVWALAAATNPPSRPPEPPSPPPGLRTPTAGPTASSPLMQPIDRIEKAGWAPSAIAPDHQGMATAWTDLLAAYSDEQLVLFLDLFDRMHQLSQQQLARLNEDTPGADTATSRTTRAVRRARPVAGEQEAKTPTRTNKFRWESTSVKWLRRQEQAPHVPTGQRERSGIQGRFWEAPVMGRTAPLSRRAGRLGERVPVQLTSFVGRSRELEGLEGAFGAARLVTVVGPGGSGKTRLALEFAARRGAASPDLHLVDLTPITDPALVPGSIATALGVREVAGEALQDTLARRIGDREVVLLDNLEQLPAAGPVIAELLAASPGLRVLATSRAPLHVRGEHQYPLAPLQLLGSVELASLDDLVEVEAVRLFVERARAIDPAFVLTSENAVAVAGICARLDGLPLAIELAAARTRLFTPTALLARLDRRLPVLTDGPMDAPLRQRTLRSTIGWSFDLLSEPDQRVFASLGVFAGGFALAAAEAVAIDPADPNGGPGVLTSLDHLVEQNVLTVAPDAEGEPRFRMLETIREFAREQVPEPDQVGLRDRHLAYFVALAERSEAQLRGPDQAAWIRRLAAEQADIRAALARAQGAHRHESMLRLAAALRRRFWYAAGGLGEGLRWLEASLAVAADAPAALRVKAQQRAAWIVWEMGDVTRSEELFEASLAAADDDDHLSRFEALIGLSLRALGAGGPELDAVADRMAEAIEHARHDGTPGALVEPLMVEGRLAVARGDVAQARARFEEALDMAREAGDVWGAGSALIQSGALALAAGEHPRAESLLAESVRLSIESGDRGGIFLHATAALAQALTAQGKLEAARSRLREGGAAVRAFENPLGDSFLLDAAAGWLASAGVLPAAVEAWAAADAYRTDRRWPVIPAEDKIRRRSWAAAREALGTVRFETLWATGRSRDVQEALDLAMVAVEAADLQHLPDTTPARRGRFKLTPREQEVLALVASGMSDGEIATALVISKKSALVHVANIKAKLGASSRVEVATIALLESRT